MSEYRHPVIGLDVDGVILDYVSGFMKYAASRGVRIGCDPDKVDSWSMSAAFPDLDDDAIWKMIEEFSEDDGFGRLAPFEGALETISELIREFPDNPLVAITSAGKSETTKRLRAESLSSIPFRAIHVLPLGESKELHLSKLPEGSLYVDDLMKNIVAAEKVGLTGIFVRRSYNTADDHSRVAHDWSDIARHIREIIAPAPVKQIASVAI
jgi:hypothetical protein|nr:hypothetical protein [Neorhizobium tomejilense]